ncbi:hypothetical protein CFC21_028164 [Triticum aestivum]|uniref:Rapid alkalinization factor n=3 Tax=Triticinae TaxID=1648030 RepID=A0A453AQP8_AEGTS|nr:rapid alkalinization factor-like [Aegilops tauschii subsp. strangulata]XP_044327715.1 rapid alkalinization factor-like [Triticum aestivum]KAF7014144.1 hypothetical protein CFC21_028164 [Triticum aestivum]
MARRALPLLLLLLAVAAVAAAPIVHASAEDGEVGTRRRLLQDVGSNNSTDTNGTAGYISYGALYASTVPCPYTGASYYNCRPGAEANPYERGCSAITQCRD